MDEQPAAPQSSRTSKVTSGSDDINLPATAGATTASEPGTESTESAAESTIQKTATTEVSSASPSPKWPLVLFVILLGVALVGGYILVERTRAPASVPTPSIAPAPLVLATPTLTPQPMDAQTDAFGELGESDEAAAIEKGLNVTDLTKLDAELTEVTKEATGL